MFIPEKVDSHVGCSTQRLIVRCTPSLMSVPGASGGGPPLLTSGQPTPLRLPPPLPPMIRPPCTLPLWEGGQLFSPRLPPQGWWRVGGWGRSSAFDRWSVSAHQYFTGVPQGSFHRRPTISSLLGQLLTFSVSTEAILLETVWHHLSSLTCLCTFACWSVYRRRSVAFCLLGLQVRTTPGVLSNCFICLPQLPAEKKKVPSLWGCTSLPSGSGQWGLSVPPCHNMCPTRADSWRNIFSSRIRQMKASKIKAAA